MANRTFIEIPSGIDDPVTLRRFLLQLIEKLDVAFGIRGQDSGFTTSSSASQIAADAVAGQIFTNLKFYNKDFNITNDRTLIDKGYLESNSTKNDEQTTIADASYSSTSPGGVYAQADSVDMDNGIVALKNKINEILVALKAANIIEV